MGTFTGVIRKNDLAGGFWELQADDGESYQLRGGDAALLVDGQRVSITGKIDKEAFGIGMSGPYLDVTSWKAA